MSAGDSDEWLREYGLPLRRELVRGSQRVIGPLRVPDRPEPRTLIAQYLADWLSTRGGLFFVFETDIWPTAAFPYLYARFLAAGTPSPAEDFIHKWPGFRFDREDEVVLAGAIALSLYQYWGFLCVSREPQWWVRIDHDDFLE